MKNYYQILGIPVTASQADIRKAWRIKAQLHHPDHNPDDPTSEELFKEVHEAYRILSDAFLRSRYDSGGSNTITEMSSGYVHFRNYFYASTKETTVKQFSEFAVTFTYTGRGRIFKKPSFRNFFVSGSPYISHRMVSQEGHSSKEVTFTYLICALKTGVLEIEPASIHIGNEIFTSERFSVNVVDTTCYFTKGFTADGSPLKVTIHYTYASEANPVYISEKKKNHVLLIPRSRVASQFHKIGLIMKVVFMVWGAFMLPYYFSFPVFLGALAGNLFGGINCMIMYKIAGVKSKFFHARKYPAVIEYLDNGYRLGESPGMPLIRGDFIYNLHRSLF